MKNVEIGKMIIRKGIVFKAVATKDPSGCTLCDLNGRNCDDLPCISLEREDRTDVVYKELIDLKSALKALAIILAGLIACFALVFIILVFVLVPSTRVVVPVVAIIAVSFSLYRDLYANIKSKRNEQSK